MVQFSGSSFCCFAQKEMLTTTAVLLHFWTQCEKNPPVSWQMSDIIHSSP